MNVIEEFGELMENDGLKFDVIMILFVDHELFKISIESGNILTNYGFDYNLASDSVDTCVEYLADKFKQKIDQQSQNSFIFGIDNDPNQCRCENEDHTLDRIPIVVGRALYR